MNKPRVGDYWQEGGAYLWRITKVGTGHNGCEMRCVKAMDGKYWRVGDVLKTSHQSIEYYINNPNWKKSKESRFKELMQLYETNRRNGS